MNRRLNRPLLRGLLLLGLVTAALTACAGKFPVPQGPGACGDQCDALVCPVGSRCALDRTCTARCEPETLSPR